MVHLVPYIDPIASLVLGVVPTVYGVKLMIDMVLSNAPIFKRDWRNTNEAAPFENEIPEMQTNTIMAQEKIEKDHKTI